MRKICHCQKLTVDFDNETMIDFISEVNNQNESEPTRAPEESDDVDQSLIKRWKDFQLQINNKHQSWTLFVGIK